MALLATGNTAKLYCLEQLEAHIEASAGRFRIVDLGCGTGSNFMELLRRHPGVEYVGVEPAPAAAEVAARNLAGFNAEIVCAPAYDLELEPAQAVVSFSVLEHVYRRPLYLACLSRLLRPDGIAFVNYDAGHFVGTGPTLWTVRERTKTIVGALLARIGNESRYQSFVRESEFVRMAAEAGLDIIEAQMFNSPIKGAWRRVPEEAKDDVMRRWLDAELAFNAAGVHYDDSLAHIFMTRNFVLRPHGPALSDAAAPAHRPQP